jgi:hypothetical protein
MTMEELAPGMLVTWLHEPRGGYGFRVPTNAKVISKGGVRIRVEVYSKREGCYVQRRVSPKALRHR